SRGQEAADSARIREIAGNLENIKISGYVHALFQKASAPGISSFSGGPFEEDVDQRFTVRRGRMKLTYDAGLSSAVVQIDATEQGVIIRDAYVRMTEPRWKTFGLQAGVQNRSFGHEVAFSSSRRETPERSRLFQTLFSGERDAGVKVFAEPPAESALGFLQAELGFYNGSGTISDYDSSKDLIARLHAGFEGRERPWTLGLGVSLYSGGQRQNSRYRYEMTGSNDHFSIDSAESNIGRTAKRRYYGADLQVSWEFPFGKSALRSEYITGQQPGSSSSSRTPRSRPDEATYVREFEGAYAVFIQQLGNSPLEAIVKYDFYDPNRDVRSAGINGNFAEGDILFSTWGYGLAWKYDEHITFTAYYEAVRNEHTALEGFEEDVSDNVLSLRLQYVF
ncbi:MAG TPA: hypothetical protein VD772_09440, partial [Anseongella sp.]|nr:hypothetical protein [Anseongella sp.]